MVNQKPGMEDIISYKRIFFIDWEGKTDIIPVPAEFGIFIVFFLAIFLKSRIGCYLDQLRYCSGGICLSFCISPIRLLRLSDSVYSSGSSFPI